MVNYTKLTPTATAPHYVHAGDAGMDLYACAAVSILPQQRALIPTGIALAIPQGYVGLVWDKSGLATKAGLTTLAGVIDASYRGEIQIAIYNTGVEPYQVEVGKKIAQLLIQPIAAAELTEVTDLDTTTRGQGGFGSTGL